MRPIAKIANFWNNPDARTRKLNRSIVLSFGFKGLGMLISLVLVPMTLHYLNKYEYGLWITISSLVFWVHYFDIGLTNGLRNRLTQALAENNLPLARVYISTTFALLALIAGGVTIIFLIFSSFADWYSLLNVDRNVPDLRLTINTVTICMCVNFVLSIIGAIYTSHQHNWVNNLIVCMGSLSSFIWIWILTHTTAASLQAVAVAYALCPVLVNATLIFISFRWIFREERPGWRHVQWDKSGQLLSLGFRFFFIGICDLVLFSTSNIVISRLFSPAEVTPYSITYRYFNLMNVAFTILLSPLWSAITDAWSRDEWNWIRNSVHKMLRVWSVSFIVVALMVVCYKFVFRIWIGNMVEVPLSLVVIMGVYTMIFNLMYLFATYCSGVEKLKSPMVSKGLAALIFIPLAVFLSHQMGIDGVPMALALVLVIPCFFMIRRYLLDSRMMKRKANN